MPKPQELKAVKGAEDLTVILGQKFKGRVWVTRKPRS